MRAASLRSGRGVTAKAGALVAMSLLAAACGSTVQGGDTRSALGSVQEDRVAPATGVGVTEDAGIAFEDGLIPDHSQGPAQGQTSAEPGPSRGGRAGAPAGAQAAAQQNNGAAPPPHDEHPGVTASTIKVGFVGTANAQAAGEAFGGGGGGEEGPDFGSTDGQIQAVVRYVNEHGGVAGRMIEPVIRNVDLTGSSTQHESICAGFTQDDRVFAVLTVAAASQSAPPCYAQSQTLYLTAHPFALDQKFFDDFSPYYWNVSGLNLSGTARLMARGLHSRGFYREGTLGVLYNDDATFRRVYDGVLKPELARLGVEVAADAGISPFRGLGSMGDVQADINNSILRFRSAGVDRILFLEAAGTISLFWITAAESQSYRPGYGLVSTNYPQVAAEFAHPDSMAMSAAVGYAPFGDTNEKHMPFPGTPAEQRCVELMSREHQEFNSRLEALMALQFCDLAFFFQGAGDGAGRLLNSASWVASAERMGSGFDAALTPVTSFGPRKHDGATVYRALSFHADCTCMHYEGDALPLPR